MKKILLFSLALLFATLSIWAQTTREVPSVYSTIQAAIDAASAGDVINVAAGTYKELLTVGKPLDIRGPNYGINPNTGTRGAEAIIMQPDGTDDTKIALTITANNVSIEGFTFEGDNPTITGTLNAAKAMVVNNSNHVQIKNNLIENYWRASIDADGSVSGINTDVNIQYNRILNTLGKATGYGSAIFFGSNTTGTIDNNSILNCRRCVYFDYNPNGGVVSITNNELDATLIGLFMNRLSQYGASTITVSNNTITSTNTDALAYNANYYSGMILTTNWNYSGNSFVLSNNAISGKFNYGILAWNNAAPINIIGGSINGSQMQVAVRHEALSATWGAIYTGGGGILTLDGVAINNAPIGVWTDDNGTGVSYDDVKTALINGTAITGGAIGVKVSGSTAGSTASLAGNTLNNTMFSSQTGNYVELVNNALNIDATGASFEGKTGAAATNTENFAIENKILHKMDNTSLGLVRVKALQFFVTTTSGTIQRGIDFAVSGEVVNIAAGTYYEEVAIFGKSNLTLNGAGQGSAIIAPVRVFALNNSGISLYNSNNITIQNLTVDGFANAALTAGVAHFKDGIHFGNNASPESNVGGNNCIFSNVTVQNVDRRGISIFPETLTNNQITYCTIINVTGVNNGQGYGQGIQFSGSGLIEHNNISNVTGALLGNCNVVGGTLSIQDNVITGLTGLTGTPFDIGINFWCKQSNVITVKNNSITANVADNTGIYVVRGGDGSEISYNTINLTGNGGLGIETGWENTWGFPIHHNTITMGKGGTGIVVTGSGTDADPMLVYNNTLTNTGSDDLFTNDYTGYSEREVGLLLSGHQYTSRTGDANYAFNGSVYNNTIDGFKDGIVLASQIYASGGFKDVDIKLSDKNSITNFETAARYGYISNTSPYPFTEIASSDVNYAQQDLSMNYWGSASPDFNTIIDGKINYCPYYLNATRTSVGPVVNANTGVGYCTIQAAINAATAGDVIEVAAGTYTENIDVSKALTILGPNASVIGNGTRNSEAVVEGPFLVNANNVTIKGFYIDGTNVNQTPDLSKRGVLVGNVASQTNVTIENNIIKSWVTGVSLAGGYSFPWNETILIKGNKFMGTSIGSTENVNGLSVLNNYFDNAGVGFGGGAILTALTGNAFINGTGRYVSAATGVVIDFNNVLAANTFDKTVYLNSATGQWYDRAIFTKINSAATVATAGATLLVSAGTFNENVTVNKRITLNGAGATTIISSAAATTPVITITASGANATDRLVISNLKVTGATGGENPGAGILVQSATASGYYTFSGVEASGNQGSGIAFNNTASVTDVKIINNCSLSNNGFGLRIATAVPSFDELTVTDCQMNDNASSAFTYNPSGTLANIGTNFNFTNCNFANNSQAGVSNQHDLSFFGFHGNASLTNVTVTSSNGPSTTHKAYGIVFTNASAYAAAGTITLNGVTVSGTVGKGALSFQLYNDMSNVSLTNVDISGCVAPWGQLLIDQSGTGIFNIGNTTLKTIGIWKTANVDATSAIFKDATTGATLSRTVLADCFQIEDQIAHKIDLSTLGLVTVKTNNLFVTTASGSIQRGIDAATAGNTVNVAPGSYNEDLLVNKNINLHGTGSNQTILTNRVRLAGPFVNVSFEDFKIERSTAPLLTAEFGAPSFNGVTFERVDFLFTGISTNPSSGGRRAITLGFGIDATIIGDGLTFKDVIFESTNPSEVAPIMILRADGGANPKGPLSFDNVTVKGSGSYNAINTYDGGNVTVTNSKTENGGSFYLSGFANLTITNNEFTGAGGVFVNGASTGANITGNTFKNIALGYPAINFSAAWGPTQNNNVTFSQNKFENVAVTGVRIYSYTAGNPNSNFLTATNNDFSGVTGIAISNAFTSFTVNAKNNHWNGCPLVSGLVDVYPYYTTISGTPGTFVFGGLISNINAEATVSTICAGSSTTIYATGGSDYLWDNSLGLGSSKVVSPSTTTLYNVTAKDANGCTGAFASVNITVTAAPTVSITGPATVVQGGSATLTAYGATTYLWNTGATTAAISVSPTSTTTYTVTGTTGTCTGTASHTLTIASVDAGANQFICNGSSATLTATSSGILSPVYVWTPGSITGATLIVSPTTTTTYTVTVNGQFSDQVTVFVNPKPVANAGADITIASGGNGTLTGSASSGTAPYTYAWTSSVIGFGATRTTKSITVSAEGDYNLVVTDAFGCSSNPDVAHVTVAAGGFTVSGNVSYYNNLNPQMHNVTVTLDQGGSALYTAVTPASGNGDYQFIGVANGTYNVKFSLTTAWGGVTSADIIAIQNHYKPVNPTLLVGLKRLAADVIVTTSSPLYPGTDAFINAQDRNQVNAKRVNPNSVSFETGNWVFVKAGDVLVNTNPLTYANSANTSNITITVGGSAVTQNFKSLCYGDVDASYSGYKILEVEGSIVDVDAVDGLSFKNYPNPFNHNTTLSYAMPVEGNVTIDIYNLTGSRVARIENGNQTEGEYTCNWDARNMPNGLYIAMIVVKTSDDVLRQQVKMILNK